VPGVPEVPNARSLAIGKLLLLEAVAVVLELDLGALRFFRPAAEQRQQHAPEPTTGVDGAAEPREVGEFRGGRHWSGRRVH
jgi:hypothetical protein